MLVTSDPEAGKRKKSRRGEEEKKKKRKVIISREIYMVGKLGCNSR
jgi:hypothetical protein